MEAALAELDAVTAERDGLAAARDDLTQQAAQAEQSHADTVALLEKQLQQAERDIAQLQV